MPAATAWTEAQIDHKQMVDHMQRHGVFAEAERLLDRIDNGSDDSEITPAAEVRDWLSGYIR